MDNMYLTLAKNIIGQCEVGNVDVIVFVKNGDEKVKLTNTIAALQHTMHFEGFKRKGKLELFGKKINIIKAHKGAVNGYKYGNARIYSLS